MQTVKKYASNRFVDKAGNINGSTIVTITSNHTLQCAHPLEGREEPFTEWIGGTIITSPLASLPTSATATTLKDWIELLVTPDTSASLPLYLWHTISTDIEAPCPVPIRL